MPWGGWGDYLTHSPSAVSFSGGRAGHKIQTTPDFHISSKQCIIKLDQDIIIYLTESLNQAP